MKRIAALALAILSPLAQAQPSLGQIERVALDVSHAYSRYSFELSPGTLEKKTSPSASALFPAYGFYPRQVAGLLWQLLPLDEDRSVLCLSVEVHSTEAWNRGLQGLSSAGLSAASPSDCSALPQFSLSPASFPALLAGVKVLDRRDVLSPTVTPAAPVLTGIDSAAVTRPGLTVSSQNASTFYVSHPYVEDALGVPVTLTLTSWVIREGFNVVHSCTDVPGGGTCEVSVSFSGVKPLVGQLLLTFSTGAKASIGVVGQP